MEYEDLTQKIIGAAMKVHKELGPGFLESVYQNALLIELRNRGIHAEANVRISVHYCGELVGDFVADVFVKAEVILELKAAQEIHAVHELQLVNYLQATGKEVGLVLNFGAPSLQVKRKHKTFRPKSNPENPVNLVNPVKTSQGFTILELLVAMTVMSLLLVLLLSMVDNATKLWRENENRVDSYREARAALGIMSRDLANGLSSLTNTNYFLLDSSAFPLVSGIGGIVTNTNSGSALFFLTALPAKAQERNSNKSDVCQVGYFAAFNSTTGSTNQSLNLYRYFRSSDPTFQRLTNGTGLFNTPAPFPNSDDTELLARNITGFTTRAYTLTNNTLINFTQTTDTPQPDLIEISIRAINQDAARKLPNDLSAWTNSNSPIIRPVEQTFTTRIRLNKP